MTKDQTMALRTLFVVSRSGLTFSLSVSLACINFKAKKWKTRDMLLGNG